MTMVTFINEELMRENVSRSQYEQISKQAATSDFKLYKDSFVALAWLVFMQVPALSWSNWNLECWFLWREENRRIRRKTLGARTRTNNKLNPHMALVWNRTRAADSFNSVLLSLSLCNKLTNLSTASVHEALYIHANSACTLVKNCKLRLMVEQTSHLIQCNNNVITAVFC